MSDRDSVSRTAGVIIGFAWRVILVALFVFALFQGIKTAYSYGHGLLYEHAMSAAPGTETVFEIKKGDDREAIAENLKEKGIIDNTQAFVLQSRLYKTHFEEGSYTISDSMTIEDLLNYFTDEAAKQKELRDKKMVSEKETKAKDSEPEVIGGNEGVEDDIDSMESVAAGEGVEESTATE